MIITILYGDTGTNLKVGEHVQHKALETKFSRVPPLFWLLQVHYSHFDERFSDGQYSSVSFLFAVLLLTVPSPMPSHW